MILKVSRSKTVLCIVAVALVLSACASRKAVDKPAAAEQDDALAIKEAVVESDGADAQGVAARAIVYFEFDSSDIRPEFNDVLLQQVRSLNGDPHLALRLEGHTDSRGSREYNIGLGERRAQSVRRFLSLNGASQLQLTTVSYGEEHPASQGDAEYAWRMNRRVELVPITR